MTEVLSANGFPVRSRMRPRTAGTTISRVLSGRGGSGVVGVVGELHLPKAAEEDDEEQRDHGAGREEAALVRGPVAGADPDVRSREPPLLGVPLDGGDEGHDDERRRSPSPAPDPATTPASTGTPCARASSARATSRPHAAPATTATTQTSDT